MKIRGLLLLLMAFACINSASAYDELLDADPTPSARSGANVFITRCALCHGSQGMGEGNLAIKLKNYPNTNLLINAKTQSLSTIRQAIIYGGSRGKLNTLMPPMGNDLSWSETESVTLFVALLRGDPKQASRLLALGKATVRPTRKLGRNIYRSRCVLCHGLDGEGDGRMARIIKDPAPANLTVTRLDNNQLLQILIGGGEAVGRSPQMPPWGDQLSMPELQSVILYINSIKHP